MPLTRSPRRTRTLAVASVLSFLAPLATAVATAAPATAVGARNSSTTSASGNLLTDPDAESVAICSTTGEDGMTVPGWTITKGEPNMVCYGAPGGYPTSSTPGPAAAAPPSSTAAPPATPACRRRPMCRQPPPRSTAVA